MVAVFFDRADLVGREVVEERAVGASVEVLVEELSHDLPALSEDPVIGAAVAVTIDVARRRLERGIGGPTGCPTRCGGLDGWRRDSQLRRSRRLTGAPGLLA